MTSPQQEPEPTGNNRNSISTILPTVVALVVIISGLYAVLSLEVASVRRELLVMIENNHNLMQEHVNKPAHPGVLVEIASLKQQFVEVETQFKGARQQLEAAVAQLHELLVRAEKRLEERTGQLDTKLQHELNREREFLQFQLEAVREQLKSLGELRPRGLPQEGRSP